MNEETLSKNSNKSKLILIISLVFAIAIIGTIIVISANSGTNSKLNNALENARRYMDELNYEQAIAYFEEAISIDSKSVEAYIGLADVYMAEATAQLDSNDISSFDMALELIDKGLEVLNDGLLETNSEEIQHKIDELMTQRSQISAQKEELTTVAEEETETSEDTSNNEDYSILHDSPGYSEFNFLQNPTSYDLTTPLEVVSHFDDTLPPAKVDLDISIDMDLMGGTRNDLTDQNGDVYEVVLDIPLTCHADCFYQIRFDPSGELKYNGFSACHYNERHGFIRVDDYDADCNLTGYDNFVLLKYDFGEVRFNDNHDAVGNITGYRMNFYEIDTDPRPSEVIYDSAGNIEYYSIYSSENGYEAVFDNRY